MSFFPIVRVVWDDAFCDHEQGGLNESKNWPVLSYGLLVRFFDTMIAVAAERVPGDEYRCVTHIPVEIVRELEIVGWEAS